MTTPRLPRICYVLSHFHPRASGAERQALAQGTELVRRGHCVRVVTRAIPGHPRDEVIQGVRVHRWVDPSPRGPLFGITFVAGVIRALRRLRPEYDLIHTHQALWEAIATGLGRPLLSRAPTLIQPASSGYYGEAEELARTKGFAWLRRCTLRNTAFAAISVDIQRQWLALGVEPRRMIRMASGVDAHHFRPGPSSSEIEGSLPGRPRVVFTGRLHPQKNLGFLLEVWPEVVRQTGAALILVGEGELRHELEAQARTLGIASDVHFAGRVDDPAGYLRAADALVLPSVAEGMSNSLLEGMATGLPCLASAIGGNTDLLQTNAGLLLPGQDRDAWARGLVQVLVDRDASRRMGAEARSRVERDYSIEAVVSRYQTLYQAMLDGSFPGKPARSRH